jgi:hypothetical protein
VATTGFEEAAAAVFKVWKSYVLVDKAVSGLDTTWVGVASTTLLVSWSRSDNDWLRIGYNSAIAF